MAGRSKLAIEEDLEEHYQMQRTVGQIEEVILKGNRRPELMVLIGKGKARNANPTYSKTARLLDPRLQLLRASLSILQQHIDSLPPEKQEIIRLRYKHNMPVQMIVDVMGIAERTYHRWRNQALQSIMEQLNQQKAPARDATGGM